MHTDLNKKWNLNRINKKSNMPLRKFADQDLVYIISYTTRTSWIPARNGESTGLVSYRAQSRSSSNKSWWHIDHIRSHVLDDTLLFPLPQQIYQKMNPYLKFHHHFQTHLYYIIWKWHAVFNWFCALFLERWSVMY